MTGKTHASCGLLIGVCLANHYEQDIFTSTTIVTLAVIASIFPDICHTQSKVGRKIPIVSFFVRLIFGHRTFTHSLLFIGLIFGGLVFIQAPIHYMLAIIFGVSSHVILDMLTPRGVQLWYPISKQVRLPIHFKTGGLVDLSMATAFVLTTVYVVMQRIYPMVNQYF